MARPRTLAFALLVLTLVAAKKDDGLDGVFEPLAKIETVQGEFVMHKKLSAFTDVQVQEGRFKSGKDRVLFVVDTPVKSIFAVKKGKALVRFPDLDFEEVTDLDASPTIGAAVKSVLAVLGATSADTIRKSYEAKVVTKKKIATVTLTPKNKTMAKAIERIVMKVEPDGRVTHVGIYEKSGDSTLLDFTKVVFNEPIDDPLFDF
jgi:outer membrane lipoprotein-sorting protein